MLPHSPENLPPIPDRSAGIPAVMRETRQSLNRLEQRFHHYAMPSIRTLSWMALLFLAGLNAAVFHARGSLDRLDGLARAQTLASLAIWVAAIACGRWIAYL